MLTKTYFTLNSVSKLLQIEKSMLEVKFESTRSKFFTLVMLQALQIL